MRPSVPLSWEYPTTMTHLFLLVELVVIREGGPSDLCASSDVDGSGFLYDGNLREWPKAINNWERVPDSLVSFPKEKKSICS